MRYIWIVICFWVFNCKITAQPLGSKFEQIEGWLPTPNTYRTASGAPGKDYWQQRADYFIDVTLDDQNQKIIGKETIVYYNNSPDKLHYLWMQLDQNLFDKHSDTYLTETNPETLKETSLYQYGQWQRDTFDGGIKDIVVTDEKGTALKFTVVKTMMRIDLPQPLLPKSAYKFNVSWSFNINNHKTHGGRTGYEYFEKDGNYLYELAHWFPRMCVYNDVRGWQNKQYLGQAEFALEFGDYVVNITVPADHVVAATGVLQNPEQVLSKEQIQRLEKAKNSFEKPILIITPEEAILNEQKTKATTTKTWKFVAKNVRDFAFASSRKFIWDAMSVNVGSNKVLAMSFYPKEGNPLWEKYSTHAVAHTLKVYSRFTVDYPYPVAISVNGPVGGMEYPMICFNGPRPEPDGTYSKATKYGLISVIIHEVGHNFFPMIIATDERQWVWIDEGFNSFVQYLTEKEWEPNYPSRRGEAATVIPYMSSDKSVIQPIMTSAENIIQLGNNAYTKTAAGLNILRETIMGRELFDFAFKIYAQRWAFKHPEPADFFRTMEDASGIDLDWFWRGWFYSTDPCDIAIINANHYFIAPNPQEQKNLEKNLKDAQAPSISKQRDPKAIQRYRVDDFPELKDFYNTYDEFSVPEYEQKGFQNFYNSLTESDKKAFNDKRHYYLLTFENKGGLVMPIILQLIYEDGTNEIRRIPAEIWRKNAEKVSKLFITDKTVKQFILDPFRETADINTDNNIIYPERTPIPLPIYPDKPQKYPNPMQMQRK